jgi:hypothetical protein
MKMVFVIKKAGIKVPPITLSERNSLPTKPSLKHSTEHLQSISSQFYYFCDGKRP